MKDVQIVYHVKDDKFHLVYQTQRAKDLLNINKLDTVNFPPAALAMIKKLLKTNKLKV